MAAAGLAALAVAMGIGRFAFTPILPMMQADLGVSISAGAWLASANYLGYFIGALSVIVVPIRAPHAIRGALATIALTTFGMGVQHHFAIWIVLRTLAGIASAWGLVSTSAWCLERLVPLRRPALESTVFAGVGTGITLAGATCLALMRLHATSSRAWIVLGIASLFVTVAIWPVFGAGDGASAPECRQVHPKSGRDGEWLRLTLCYGAYGFGYIIPATFLPVMARQAIADPAVFGLSWPIFGAAAITSTMLVSRVRRRVTNRRIWIICHLVMALGIALPVIRPGITATILAAGGVGGTFLVVTMVGMQEARDVAGPRATALMAAMTSAFALGQIVGPMLAGGLHGTDGSFSASLLVACSALLVSAWGLFQTPAVSHPGDRGV